MSFEIDKLKMEADMMYIKASNRKIAELEANGCIVVYIDRQYLQYYEKGFSGIGLYYESSFPYTSAKICLTPKKYI
jgi:hypothetical protein